MSDKVESVAKVHAALRQAAGDRAEEILHRRSKHLANLTPHELAQSEPGARIVLKELDKILVSVQTPKDK